VPYGAWSPARVWGVRVGCKPTLPLSAWRGWWTGG